MPSTATARAYQPLQPRRAGGTLHKSKLLERPVDITPEALRFGHSLGRLRPSPGPFFGCSHRLFIEYVRYCPSTGVI